MCMYVYLFPTPCQQSVTAKAESQSYCKQSNALLSMSNHFKKCQFLFSNFIKSSTCTCDICKTNVLTTTAFSCTHMVGQRDVQQIHLSWLAPTQDYDYGTCHTQILCLVCSRFVASKPMTIVQQLLLPITSPFLLVTMTIWRSNDLRTVFIVYCNISSCASAVDTKTTLFLIYYFNVIIIMDGTYK